MSRKKKITERIAAMNAHQRFIHANTLQKKFPHVLKLVLDLSFRDGDSGKETSRSSSTRGPEHVAAFDHDCPDWECVNGGFKLGPAIEAMLTNKQHEINGEVICQGWQDQERIGKFHCYKKLVYRVTAEYA